MLIGILLLAFYLKFEKYHKIPIHVKTNLPWEENEIPKSPQEDWLIESDEEREENEVFPKA